MHKTVHVEFSHTVREDASVDIDLDEYYAWLGLTPDETIELNEADVLEYLRDGDQSDITGYATPYDDFEIEQVDCA